MYSEAFSTWLNPNNLFRPSGKICDGLRRSVLGASELKIGLSEEGSKELEWLRDETGANSNVDVIRSALQFYLYSVKQVSHGNTICIADKDDNIIESDILKERK